MDRLKHPVKLYYRIGEVSDTSEAMLYLAGASFVSGTVLAVDGGYSSGR